MPIRRGLQAVHQYLEIRMNFLNLLGANDTLFLIPLAHGLS